MKKIILLFSIMLIPALLCSQNLIQDGTFSTQTGGITDATTPWKGNTVSSSQILTDDLTGSTVGNLNNGSSLIYQTFPVNEGYTYQVSFDYRWVTGSPATYTCTVRFRNAATNTDINVTDSNLSNGYLLSTTPDVWHKASFKVTIPSGITEARLNIFKNARILRIDNVSVRRLYTFNGNSDSDFSNASNWDLGEIPTDDDIIIPASKTIVLNSGATAGNVSIDGSSTFTINPGGSLVIATGNNVSGNITYSRTLQANKWHFLTPPVVGETYDDTWIATNGIASGTGNNRGISTYQNGTADPTTGQWVYVQAGGSGTFETSKGYALRRSSTGDVSFTGTYPTGAKPFAASINSNAYNLVGNPYPMYLSIANFFTNNTQASGKLTEETVWIWDQSANSGSGGYVQKTSGLDGTFQIAPGQAFFISSGNASNIIFYQFNGTNQSDTFLKSSKTQVNLQMVSNGISASTELYYLPEGTVDFDNGYDASQFSGVATQFEAYTTQLSNAAKKLARQVLSNSDLETVVVPIGLKVEAGKEITFTAEAMNFPQGIHVYLEDRLTNSVTRLDEANSNYKVIINETLNGTGRFYLHTKSSSVLSTNNLNAQSINVFTTSSQNLRVVGVYNNKATLKLYNIVGKEVLNQSFSAKGVLDINLPKLAKGVYVVQLSAENSSINKKIIIE